MNIRFRLVLLLALCLSSTQSIRADFRGDSKTIHLDPAGKDPYVYEPFLVPDGAEEVVVEVDYDRAGGENAIDFAIFDARASSKHDDLAGYRGKNPNRPPLISRVGKISASDGHIAGPIPGGTWYVMFYVYKTKPNGVDVRLNTSFSVAAPYDRSAQQFGKRWYRGDLHAHTLHSDGLWTVTSLGAAAQQSGLDFIAVTDHNVASHHAEVDHTPADGPLFIRGVEITTTGGHMNAWGMASGVVPEHRQIRDDAPRIEELTAQVHATGAKVSINHPFALCKACDWTFDQHASGFDSIEVWNGPWSEEDEKALRWWDSLLRLGRRITAIGSSDSHGRQNAVGQPCTNVLAPERSSTALLDGIAKAHVVITQTTAIQFDMSAIAGNSTALIGEELHLPRDSSAKVTLSWTGLDLGKDGAAELILYSDHGVVQSTRVDSASGTVAVTAAAKFSWIRAELRTRTGQMLVLSNPIWFAS